MLPILTVISFNNKDFLIWGIKILKIFVEDFLRLEIRNTFDFNGVRLDLIALTNSKSEGKYFLWLSS